MNTIANNTHKGRIIIFFFVLLFYWITLPIYGKGTTVDSLSIHVLLEDNGTARIKETWAINVGSGISEWYLVQGHLGNMEIKDFSVTDEKKHKFITDPKWIIERSIEEKAGHCGLVDKGANGYELCWGVGSEGKHLFTASYTMTNLVKSYNEADGFNHMFVARKISTPPAKIKLTIEKADSAFNYNTTKVWSFGYKGNINIVDGRIIAETTGKFISEFCMIALVRFEKGLFHPAEMIKKDFEEVKELAFKDSDYEKKSETSNDEFEYAWEEHLYNFLEPVFGDYTAIILLVVFAIILYLIYRFIKRCFIYFISYVALLLMKMKEVIRQRRRISVKNIPVSEWYRDIPCHGNLVKSNCIYNTQFFKFKNEYRCLIEAYILRLIQHGVLGLTQEMDKKGRMQTFIQINSWKSINKRNTKDEKNLEGLFEIFKNAAGKDQVLQQKELKRWGRHHSKELYNWFEELKDYNPRITENDKQQVLGLRKYLKDFSIINERHVVEVKLWNEYLVYATLFGIADQVKKDFMNICPEYMDLLDSASRLSMNTDVNKFIGLMAASTFTTVYFAHRVVDSSISKNSGGGGGDYDRDSGYGGSSSIGGGGGYSGGGSGGGGR